MVVPLLGYAFHVMRFTRSLNMHSYTLRLLTCLGILIFALSLTGCRICKSCEDFDYPSYGGSWQRTVRDQGRVGSLFDPAGAKVASLTDRDAPDTEDEIERSKPENQDDPMNDELEGEEAEDSDSDTRDREPNQGDLDNQDLNDIESEKDDSLEDLKLDDIEVRLVPSKAPVMINTK